MRKLDHLMILSSSVEVPLTEKQRIKYGNDFERRCSSHQNRKAAPKCLGEMV